MKEQNFVSGLVRKKNCLPVWKGCWWKFSFTFGVGECFTCVPKASPIVEITCRPPCLQIFAGGNQDYPPPQNTHEKSVSTTLQKRNLFHLLQGISHHKYCPCLSINSHWKSFFNQMSFSGFTPIHFCTVFSWSHTTKNIFPSESHNSFLKQMSRRSTLRSCYRSRTLSSRVLWNRFTGAIPCSHRSRVTCSTLGAMWVNT